MPKGDIHTTYNSDNDNWQNKRVGASRASSTHDTKADASSRGQDLARNTGSEWFGHKRNGNTINERRSYGNDPFPPRDND